MRTNYCCTKRCCSANNNMLSYVSKHLHLMGASNDLATVTMTSVPNTCTPSNKPILFTSSCYYSYMYNYFTTNKTVETFVI